MIRIDPQAGFIRIEAGAGIQGSRANDGQVVSGIFVHIFNRKLGDDRQVSVELPVSIGRDPGNAIVLDIDDERYSRWHAEIQRARGGLELKDKSKNGTKIGSRTLKQEAAPLADEGRFAIFDYEFAVMLPAELQLILVGAGDAAREAHVLTADEGLFIIADKSGARIERATRDKGVSKSALAGKTALLCYLDGDKPVLANLGEAPGDEVQLNNAYLGSKPVYLQPYDVIFAGAARVEIHPVGRKARVCGNATCGLLNPDKLEENCRWCGDYLANSVTRII